MVFFRRKFKVRARDSRGQGTESGDASAPEALKALLGDEGYPETKEDYDNMGTDDKASFIAALGELGPMFESGPLMIDMTLNTLDDGQMQAIYDAINQWQEERE